MSSTLHYGKEGRKKIQDGVNAVANAVKVTLGAKGRNVAIGKGFGHLPEITKDGVTVANFVTQLADPVEDMGAMMVKDAARQTYLLVGDGTTTSTILAQAIFNEGIAAIDAGSNPMDLKKGIDKAVTEVVKHIKEMSIPISDDSQLLSIATIAANNDVETGKIVVEAIHAAGPDGQVLIGISKTSKTSIEKVEGMTLERGYLDENFCNNKEKMMVELENPYILIYDKKITRLNDFRNILEISSKQGKPLLIIAEDIEGEALFTMTANAVKGFKWAAIRSPFGGTEELEDIAAFTGATVVSESKGHVLKDITEKCFGTCNSITINKFSTVIEGGKGKKHDITQRTTQIRQQLEGCTDDYQKPSLVKRLAKISNGVVVIYVGGQTEVEMLEKKARIDDAKKATLASIEEGIVPGGGMAYLNISGRISILGNKDELVGQDIIKRAIQEPFKQIMNNSGLNPDEIAKGLSDSNTCGYNVKSEKYEDFIQTGIIDPAKVSRVALENAASVAGMLLTTECVIV